MAESTLSPVTAAIRRRVAHYLGYNRWADTSEGLSAAQDTNVTACVEDGERRFAGSHDWGFLRPRLDLVLWSSVAVAAGVTVAQAASTTLTATGGTPFLPSMVGHSIVITTVGTKTITGYTSSTVVTVDSSATFSGKTFSIAADGIYRLPDNFGGLETQCIPYARGSSNNFEILVVSPEIIRKAWQINDTTGRPRQGAVEVVQNDGTGQRWNLLTDPVPDQDYTVNFFYNALSDAMGADEYVAGGMLYADALIKCCLAAAEEQYNENENAMRAQEAQALQKAIRLDLKYNRPRRLGPTTTSNFRDNEDAMDSRATGFVYRGQTQLVEY